MDSVEGRADECLPSFPAAALCLVGSGWLFSANLGYVPTSWYHQ